MLMAADHDAATTHRLEHWVHRSLLAGVSLSTLLLIGGVAVHLFQPRGTASAPLRSSWTTLARPGAAPLVAVLLDAGLVVLMATPLLRVAVLAAGWFGAGNVRFGMVALTVLGLLVLSMWLGHG